MNYVQQPGDLAAMRWSHLRLLSSPQFWGRRNRGQRLSFPRTGTGLADGRDRAIYSCQWQLRSRGNSRILRAAYDQATAELNDHGHARVVREIIGKRIVALAVKGERDPERLCDSGLVAAGLRRRSL